MDKNEVQTLVYEHLKANNCEPEMINGENKSVMFKHKDDLYFIDIDPDKAEYFRLSFSIDKAIFFDTEILGKFYLLAQEKSHYWKKADFTIEFSESGGDFFITWITNIKDHNEFRNNLDGAIEKSLDMFYNKIFSVDVTDFSLIQQEVTLKGETIGLTGMEIKILKMAYSNNHNSLSINEICKETGLEANEAQIILAEMIKKQLAKKINDDTYEILCGMGAYGFVSDLSGSKNNDARLRSEICP